MKTGNLLSACMMVKNEEKNIERCLRSIKKLVDEIVVVDTGSTDNTVKIAKRFGARVYHHEWQNDFSLHRNQSIGYARGTWVMIIDADEEFALSDGATYGQVREFLTKIAGKYPAAALNVKDMQKGMNTLQFNSTRIFRKGLVEYQGIVHNQPVLKIDGEAALCTGAFLYHYGYDLTPEQKAGKFLRTSTLLLKQIEEGQIINALPYFFLCQLYADDRQSAEAIKWGEMYWDHRAEAVDGSFCDSIYFVMTKQYMKLGDTEKANEWLNRGVEALPGDLDLALAALEYGVWIDNVDLKIQACKDFIQIYRQYQKNPALKANRFVFAMRPEALAYVYFHQTVTEIKDGTQAMSNLITLLQTLAPAFRDGMMQELEDKLSQSAFPVHFQREEAPVIDPTESKANFVSATLQ